MWRYIRKCIRIGISIVSAHILYDEAEKIEWLGKRPNNFIIVCVLHKVLETEISGRVSRTKVVELGSTVSQPDHIILL